MLLSTDRIVLKACIEAFPECRNLLADHMSDYGELLQHVFYPNLINDALIDLLESNKDADKIKKYCAFIEFMWQQGDDSIKNVVDVSILERLSDDPEVWQRFGTYISDEFKQYINAVAIPENLSFFNVKELM